MEAESRDAVFAALRKRGIKAIKVVAADGSKANGELRGVRKRIVVIIACLVAVVAGVSSYVGGSRSSATADLAANGLAALSMLDDTTRRQVIGDQAIIEKGIRSGWSDVFESEGDRFLASFAIPGVKAGVRATSIKALEDALTQTSQPPKLQASISLEARQIKAMVEGMKAEARAYIAAGGTIVEYGKRLTERQDTEIAIYKRAEDEILKARETLSESAFSALLDQRNDELRNLGIRPITLPE